MPQLQKVLRIALRALPLLRGKHRLVTYLGKYLGRPQDPVAVRLINGARMFLHNGRYDFWYLGIQDPDVTYAFLHQMNRLPLGAAVIDVGANVGYLTCLAAQHLRRSGKGVVYAFEPHPLAYLCLKKNVEFNGFTNVVLVQSAVSDQNGKTQLFTNREDTVFSSIARASPDLNPTEICETVALDSFFQEIPDVAPALMKIDIQGAELLALRGAKGLLERHHPAILLEEWPYGYESFGYSVRELKQFLRGFGYRFYEVRQGRLRWSVVKPVEVDVSDCGPELESYTNLLCVYDND